MIAMSATDATLIRVKDSMSWRAEIQTTTISTDIREAVKQLGVTSFRSRRINEVDDRSWNI